MKDATVKETSDGKCHKARGRAHVKRPGDYFRALNAAHDDEVAALLSKEITGLRICAHAISVPCPST